MPNSMSQLEDALWRATMIVLGYDPDTDNQEIQKRVRINWPLSETGSPNWKREENTVFIQIQPIGEPYSELSDITHEYDSNNDSLKEKVSYHRSFEISWICYGPEAFETADTIRIGVMRENIRAFLKTHSVAIMPHLRMSNRIPEQDATGEWWNRYDTTGQFYERVTRSYEEDFIDKMPVINIIR